MRRTFCEDQQPGGNAKLRLSRYPVNRPDVHFRGCPRLYTHAPVTEQDWRAVRPGWKLDVGMKAAVRRVLTEMEGGNVEMAAATIQRGDGSAVRETALPCIIGKPSTKDV